MKNCLRPAMWPAVIFTLALALFAPSANAQKKGSASQEPSAKAADLQAIRESGQAFSKAFAKADAKAIAALWTEEGEYVDDAGKVCAGRDAIEKEYAEFFQAHPGHKLSLVVDSLKLLSDSAAIEDGRALLDPAPPGAPMVSKYTAVHVKVDGKWLMSNVRDTHVETPSTYRQLQSLEWMIGSWAAEEHGVATEATCRWIANKSFIERTYKVTSGGQVKASGVQIIGWNPQTLAPQSWMFSSDGGHAVGQWSSQEASYVIETHGLTADGTPTSAVTLLTPLDEKAFSWKSISRSAAGNPLPDTDEIILKRKP
ncbi:SgcJ/EcaC family oxidoreductase [Anatilimnocola sp. NA78]|uniref:YybH family protein n=1 Tax=Anatilimnocola sp. NA78 TaxID=3415683 RepID=UPI003CE511FE